MPGRSSLLFFILPLILLFQTPAGPLPARMFVYADGDLHRVETAAADPEALLAQAGVEREAGDELLVDGVPLNPGTPITPRDGLVLQVVRAMEVTVNGRSIETTARSVAAAAAGAGLRLRLKDALQPAPETPLQEGMSIAHRPARLLQIETGQGVVVTRSAAETVGAALAEAGLPLQHLDFSQPAADKPLPEDGRLQVVRVVETIELEQTTLPFETLLQPLPDVEIDTQQVVQPGAFGLLVSRVRVRSENGVEVSREKEEERVAAPPSPRIVGYGTNIVVRTMDTPDGPIEYWRAVPAFATSYSPCRLGTDFCGNTTASGLPLEKGLVAVIRPWYNAMVFSQVYVPGYGVGTIADIGAGVSGQHWIDLGYSDDDWVSWSQTVTVYFLTPVPPADQILWILP